MFQVMRDLQKELLVTDSIVYADDRNLMNLSEASAQVDITYIHSTGSPLGLVLNLLKCVIRRVVAISAYTNGGAKRPSLSRILPPPRVELDYTPLPTDLPIKVLGSGVHWTDGARLEIAARASETHSVTKSFSEMIKGGSTTKKWRVSH